MMYPCEFNKNSSIVSQDRVTSQGEDKRFGPNLTF